MKPANRFLGGLLLAVVIIAAFLNGAVARTEHSAPFTIYTAPTGSDVAGCGSSASPCKTPAFAYQNLQRYDDLQCQQVVIQRAPGTYDDPWTLSGPLTGLCGGLWMAQVVVRGDPAHPENYVWRPTSGIAAISVQNGAMLYAEGFTFQGDGVGAAGNDFSTGGQMMVGTTWGSFLGLGKNVFGCNPSKIDIQPSGRSGVYFYSDYSVDQTKCGSTGGGGTTVNTFASSTVGSNQLGLASPSGVVSGMAISAPCVSGKTVSSIAGAWVTMSGPANCTNGYQAVTFTSGGGGGAGSGPGCAKAHIQQDALSLTIFLAGGPTAPLTVTRLNAPCYNSSGVVMLDWAESRVNYVIWKGVTSGGAPPLWQNTADGRAGFLFNSPTNNQITVTP